MFIGQFFYSVMSSKSSVYLNYLKRISLFFGAIFLVVGTIGGFYVASVYFGPSKDFLSLFGGNDTQIVDNEMADKQIERSQSLEERFFDIVKVRRATPEDLEILKAAIDAQESALVSLGGYDRENNDRLRDLTKSYHDYAGAPLRDASDALEMEARSLESDREFDAALEKYKASYEKQLFINRNYPEGKAYNVRRTASLERKIDSLTARPRYHQSKDLEAEADTLIERQEWEAAKAKLQEALEIQRGLNLEFRGILYADIKRLSTLESKLASLESSDLARSIAALKEEGRKFEQQDRFIDAAEAYQRAMRLQDKLNMEHPRSYFASTREVEALKRITANARSHGLGREILEGIERLDSFLLNKQVHEANELTQRLVRKLEVFQQNYPESTLISETNVNKVQYLHHIRGDIGFYQERILAQALPIPGETDVLMLQSEVPQALYANIMLSNPSRNRGDRNPVDSVVWDEAKAFAQRVSWLLGMPVRLPYRSEYEAAVGNLQYLSIDEFAWHTGNSGERSQEIATKRENRHGFHDLLGNVAEWLEPSGLLSEGEALLAGGDAQTSIDELVEVPVNISNRRTRNLMVGFRVVIETEPTTTSTTAVQ